MTAIPEVPSDAAREEFDLSKLSPNPTDHTRLLRTLFGVGLVVPVGGLIWYAVTLPASALANPGQLVVIALVLLFTLLLVLVVIGLGPGASRCLVDGMGFTLYFKRGKARRYDWSDPTLRLTIEEISGDNWVEYSFSTGLPFTTTLTPELWSRLLTEARRHGLSVQIQSSGRTTPTVTTFRITQLPSN